MKSLALILEEGKQEFAESLQHIFMHKDFSRDIAFDEIDKFAHTIIAAIRKEVSQMNIENPKCDCRAYSMGAHNCDVTSNEAIDDVLSNLASFEGNQNTV